MKAKQSVNSEWTESIAHPRQIQRRSRTKEPGSARASLPELVDARSNTAAERGVRYKIPVTPMDLETHVAHASVTQTLTLSPLATFVTTSSAPHSGERSPSAWSRLAEYYKLQDLVN